MGLASCSKVTFLLPFNFMPESSPFAVEFLSISADARQLRATDPGRGKSGPVAKMTVPLVQKRKTIPAEGSAECVVAPECSEARSKSGRPYTKPRYSARSAK